MHFRFLLLLTLFSQGILFSQGEWERVFSPTARSLNVVFTLDSTHYWAAGDSGLIMFSSDAGRNWSIQQDFTSYYINDIYFSDYLYGWAVGLNNMPPLTMLYKTSDGGVTWDSMAYEDPLTAMKTVYFINRDKGFLAGKNGFVLTTDRGSNWKPCNLDSYLLNVINIKFVDEMRGFAVGGIIDITGLIYRTTDGGENWFITTVSSEPIWDLFIKDSLNYMAIGGDFEWGTSITTSSNGGNTWDYRLLEVRGVGTSISDRTASEIWGALGNDKTLICSLDSGNTFTVIPTPDSTIINDLEFSDSLHGILVGDTGVVYLYKQNLVSIRDEKDNYLSKFSIEQNYPNPFNSSTVISYLIPETGIVNLHIYDILGKTIRNISLFSPAGESRFQIDLNDSPSGIYLYSVSFGQRLLTGKMIYMK